MVGISAALLDHEVTLGMETAEDTWVPATVDHHFSFGLFLVFLQVRNKVLLHLSHCYFLLLFTTELNLKRSLSQESDFSVFFVCSFVF